LLAPRGPAADELRSALGESTASVARFDTPLSQAGTRSLAAWKALARGDELRARGKDIETAAQYQLAIDLDPDFAIAYSALGAVYENAEKIEASRRLYAKAYELRAHAGERDRLRIAARYHTGEGDLEKVVQVYILWRELYPRDVVPANNLVDIYLNMGEPAKALQAAHEAVRLAPGHAVVQASLMRAERRAGNYLPAKAVYDELVARAQDGVVAHLERVAIAAGERDDAEIQRQLEWARGRPQEVEILNAAVAIAASRGQGRAARQRCDEVARAAARDAMTEMHAVCLRECAEYAVSVGETEQARADIERALSLEPDSRRSLASAARVYASLGESQRVEDLAQRAGELYPADFVLHRMMLPLARAAAHLQRRAPEAALRELQALEPYDVSRETELEPLYLRGEALLQAGRPDEAAAQYRKLLEHWRFQPESQFVALSRLGLARAATRGRDAAAARAEYERFFGEWSQADADTPVLLQARAEYAKLR
jgi:tetratricopeptide (TPR) repeat protein